MTAAGGIVGECVRWLREHDDVVIASHLDPDGDSLGCSLALAAALEQRGKRCEIVLPQPLSQRHRWLPGCSRIAIAEAVPAGARAAVLIECSDFARAGLAGVDRIETLNIDHHGRNTRYADLNWVEPDVAAAGMMIERLIGALGAELDQQMATQLYVTVLTDTGSFHHSNTDAEALEFAARMVRAGAEPSRIAEHVYGDVPAGRVRLIGDALSSLELVEHDRIAWMHLQVSDFERRGTQDTEGIINLAQGIAGVRISVLFKETASGQYRISLRSDGSVDVAEVAAEFGGGGHPRAAGCGMQGRFAEVRERLLAAVRSRLDGSGSVGRTRREDGVRS